MADETGTSSLPSVQSNKQNKGTERQICRRIFYINRGLIQYWNTCCQRITENSKRPAAANLMKTMIKKSKNQNNNNKSFAGTPFTEGYIRKIWKS